VSPPIGVAPAKSSQVVVDRLSAAADALHAGAAACAAAQLQPPMSSGSTARGSISPPL
jgi:hypothetical protein